VWILFLGFFMLLLAVPPRFSTEVDWEVWKGTLGMLVRNFRTTKVVFCVSVSVSSGAG